MYKVFCVSYDLNAPGKDYQALYEELKKSPNWWHYLDSTWLIYSNETAQQVYNRIAPHIDKNDQVLVIRGTTEYYGWLSEEAWGWIKKYIR